MKAYVALNAEGRRIGAGHPKARFSDADVLLIQDMHADGLGYRRIAKAFKTSPSSIQSILTCRTRAQWADRHKLLPPQPLSTGQAPPRQAR